jgi:hypothetical protein
MQKYENAQGTRNNASESLLLSFLVCMDVSSPDSFEVATTACCGLCEDVSEPSAFVTFSCLFFAVGCSPCHATRLALQLRMQTIHGCLFSSLLYLSQLLRLYLSLSVWSSMSSAHTWLRAPSPCQNRHRKPGTKRTGTFATYFRLCNKASGPEIVYFWGSGPVRPQNPLGMVGGEAPHLFQWVLRSEGAV